MASRSPLFLAKAGYRSRRLSDAARLLPILGLFLLILPAFWTSADNPTPSTSAVGVYLFAIWAGLIAAAAGLSRLLPKPDERPAPPEDLP